MSDVSILYYDKFSRYVTLNKIMKTKKAEQGMTKLTAGSKINK